MKNYRGLLFLLIILTYSLFANAQEQRLQVIKEAVVFMAKINNVSNVTSIQDSNSIKSLINYSNGKNIQGLNRLIKSWNESTYYKKNDIEELSKIILNDLTGGDKSDRKIKYEVPYKNFKINLEKISKANKDEQKNVVDTVSQNKLLRNNRVKEGDKIIDPIKPSINTKSDKELYISYIALFFSLVSIVLFFAGYKKYNSLKSDYHKLKDKFYSEYGSFKFKVEEFISAKSSIVEKSVNTISPSQTELTMNSAPNMHNQTANYLIEEVSQQKDENIIKYAKSSDNGGFNTIDLKNKQNGECIYELHIKGKNGFFKLSTDKKVRQYTLSSNPEYYFKPDSCQMEGIPSSDKTIETKAPGKITLNSDETKWLIDDKISLIFR